MSQAADLKRAEQAAWWAFQEDGLSETLLGIFLAATAGSIHDDGLAIPWLLLMFFSPLILKAGRRRFTYPRIGYAKLDESRQSKVLRGVGLYTILAIGAMAVTIALVARADGSVWGLWRRWSPTLAGVILSGGFIYLATVSAARRYHAFAVIAVGLGISFSLWSTETYTGLKIYLLTAGGALLLYGVGAFSLFLRRHELPPEDALDGTD